MGALVGLTGLRGVPTLVRGPARGTTCFGVAEFACVGGPCQVQVDVLIPDPLTGAVGDLQDEPLTRTFLRPGFGWLDGNEGPTLEAEYAMGVARFPGPLLARRCWCRRVWLRWGRIAFPALILRAVIGDRSDAGDLAGLV